MKTPVRTRLLSALLSLVMLVSLLPVSVFAAEPEAGTWTKVELADITADDTVAIMHTSMGDISIRFFPEAGPRPRPSPVPLAAIR